MKKVRSVIDDFSGVAFHNCATTKWLSLRMNFLFNLAFFIVLIVLVPLPASAIYPSKRPCVPYVLLNQDLRGNVINSFNLIGFNAFESQVWQDWLHLIALTSWSFRLGYLESMQCRKLNDIS